MTERTNPDSSSHDWYYVPERRVSLSIEKIDQVKRCIEELAEYEKTQQEHEERQKAKSVSSWKDGCRIL